MEEIIRSQAQIADAPTSVLVRTYNELTGSDIKKFRDRSVAENRVAMAILSARDKVGHLGVPKGAEPAVLTFAEREALAKSKGIELQEEQASLNTPEIEEEEVDDGGEVDLNEEEKKAAQIANVELVENPSPLPPAADLEGHPKPVKAAKAEGTGRKPKRVINRVKATGIGKSKPQADSRRGQVLAYILAAPDQTATYSDLQARFGDEARGCVFKLYEKDHLIFLED